MSLSSFSVFNRRRPLIRLILLIVVFYAAFTVRRQYLFEKFLDTLYITFDDFPPEYAAALNESVATKNDKPVDYDNKLFGEPKIPKIIHFIWYKNLYESHKEVTEIPSIGSHAPELCKKYNPDFEIRIWGKEEGREFIEKNYKWFIPTYDGYAHPIQRVDALKYFVLLHYGGVYMDLDIACRRPLDPLLQFPAWFPEASPLGVNNDLMASAPGHPVMERMAYGLKAHNWNYIFPYLTIFWTTGPQFTSDILREWFQAYKGKHHVMGSDKKNADPGHFFILPQVFYSESHTFFGHSPGGTWHGGDVAVVLWFVAHPYVFFALLGTLLTTCLCAMRRKRRSMHSIRSKEDDMLDRV